MPYFPINPPEYSFSPTTQANMGIADLVHGGPHRYAQLSQTVPVASSSNSGKGKARALDVEFEPSYSSFLARWQPISSSHSDLHPPLLVARDNVSPQNKGINVVKSVPILILIIVGSIVLITTISISLAWLCRGMCTKKPKSRHRRLNNAMWSPGATESIFEEKKISHNDGNLSMPATPLPVLLSDQPSAIPAPGGRGWSLHDPPVNSHPDTKGRHLHTKGPSTAVASTARDYNHAYKSNSQWHGIDAGKTDLEKGQHVAAPIEQQPARQPTFIARAIQQRRVPLPLPANAPQLQPQTKPQPQPKPKPQPQPQPLPLPPPQYRLQFQPPVAVMTRAPTRQSQASESKTSRTSASHITYQGEVFTKGPYPTVRPLPGYGTETPRIEQGTAVLDKGNFRFPGSSPHSASHGGRRVMSMLPSTFRNVARAGISNRHMRPHSLDDSDFEGTIGGRDRELPMAKRIGKKDPRFSVDYSTEGEPSPRVFGSPLPLMQGTPRPHGMARPDATPGLAGVGVSWSKPRRYSAFEIGQQQTKDMNKLQLPQPQRQSMNVPAQASHIESFPSNVLMNPPARPQSQFGQLLKQASVGDSHQKLIDTVNKWQQLSKDAEPVGEPFSTPAFSVSGDGKKSLVRSNSVAASEAAVSDVTSISRTSTVKSLTMFFEGKGAISKEKSPVPSICPQFAATTTLSNWLEPAKVSTTHGLVLEEEALGDINPVVEREPFGSDIDVMKKKPSALSLNPSEFSLAEAAQPVQLVSAKAQIHAEAKMESDSEHSMPPSYRTFSDKGYERRGWARAIAPHKPRYAPQSTDAERRPVKSRTMSQPGVPEGTRFSDRRRRSYAAPRNMADHDDDDSSDSDISVRRWGANVGPTLTAATSVGRRRRG